MKLIDDLSLGPIEPIKTLDSTAAAQGRAHASFPAIQLSQGVRTDGHDQVAIEAPVAIVINGISYAVMMASPEALEDFAFGFALSESIVDHVAQIYDCDVVPHPHGYNVELRIANECFFRIKERQRQLSGRTGCGLCGISSIEELLRDLAPLDTPSGANDTKVSLSAITLASQRLRAQQALMEITGATHAAAWCDLAGEIVVLREDVGRHNALDKVIGALARDKHHSHAGFALITSRASYELIEKCVRARIAVLAAVSGVTSLAIEVAQSNRLCLLGYTRESKTTIYTHPQRIHNDAALGDINHPSSRAALSQKHHLQQTISAPKIMDNLDKLIRMANQIGSFFESMPDRDEGLAGIANHLQKFWTPSMRQTLLSAFEAKDLPNEPALNTIVISTLEKYGKSLMPKLAH